MSISLPPFAWSTRTSRSTGSPISELMAAKLANPDLISLAAGFVDDRTLPTESTLRLMAQTLDGDEGRVALQYGTTIGDAELRQTLLEHLASLDGVSPAELHATADDIVITNGSQQLLYLLTDLLVDEGDIVITGWPTYFVYTGLLPTLGARVCGVEMDEQGMRPDDLERVLGELEAAGSLGRVKLVYLCSYHQNPTGLTLAEDRRPAVLDIIQRFSRTHRILLLEDAAYRELTFDGSPPRSLRSFDATGRFVAIAQTFSKPFAPGLKLGYGLLPRDIVGPLVVQKGHQDFGSANLAQRVALAAMRDGTYQSHLASLCRSYAAKRDAMLEALEAHMADLRSAGASWTRPSGGLYVWLTLPEAVDTRRAGALFDEAVKRGVLYVPGDYAYPDDPARRKPTNTIRLSFGVPTVEQIHDGVARLADAVHAVTAGAASSRA